VTDLAALTPMIVVAAAFVALIVTVKRLADREAAEEHEAAPTEPDTARGTTPQGPRVHMVPVDLDPDEPGPATPGRPAGPEKPGHH
jgi:hypothetical protein